VAEHEVKAQVSAVFDYIGICGIHLVAELSHKTKAAVKSAYAENTCKNTCESLIAHYGTSAFYEKFGLAGAEAPHAAGMNRRI
jgi:hypothetical protein